jgi:hypothetical protein
MVFIGAIFFSLFSLSYAADLTQDQWVSFMVRNLPSVFCQPGQFYIDCYEVTKEECVDAASSATEACIDNRLQELPEIFTYKESRHWGSIIEKCVDQEYSSTYIDQKKDTEECKEVK